MSQNPGFEVDEILLPFGVSIISGEVDPSVALADQPPGSIYLRTNGETWKKMGTGVTEWTSTNASDGVIDGGNASGQ